MFTLPLDRLELLAGVFLDLIFFLVVGVGASAGLDLGDVLAVDVVLGVDRGSGVALGERLGVALGVV